jgi:hypothetical protein
MKRSVRSRIAKAAAARAKAKGVRLGNPRINLAGKAATATLRAKSDAFARTMWPVLAALRSEGILSYRAIARALNERGIASARGGKRRQEAARGGKRRQEAARGRACRSR